MNFLYSCTLLLFLIKLLKCYKLVDTSGGTKLQPRTNSRTRGNLKALPHLKDNYYYCGENKVALVTGAGRGIGREIAKTLANSVSHIVCLSRSQKSCDLVVDELKAMGCDASGYGVNFEVKEEISELMKNILSKHETIDILVNNAGIIKDNLFLRMSDKEWYDVLNVNLNALFHVTQPVAKRMLTNRYGRIINISSISGIVGNTGQANYASSKGAVISFTKTLAKELSPKNITVNAIAPGYIISDMTNSLGDEIRKKVIERTFVGRLGTQKDIANMVGYIASEAASYITGMVFTVDGGLTL
ncbi:3-oxoacyl-[acyl-carrier-protein] reductase [Hepatocystis sp. ex Piliocolobus tephrosceles]|nr:3-oxoacyl-[acyl-carrier-protein] reductase [Hepatocystis sp. ex Piliocolobus tephrosceles]